MSNTADLLDALSAHLATFELPALFSVRLTNFTSSEPNVSAQLACHQPPQIAAGLLAWADTLSGVTTSAWRAADGNCLHLMVTGQISGGVTVEAYGAVPFTGRGIGADLAPQSMTTVSLAALRAMATLGEVTL